MQHAGPWKAIIIEAHMFYFEPPNSISPVTQVHETSEGTNCQRAARTTWVWKGRWVGGEHDQEVGGSRDPTKELRGGAAGQGTAGRVRHSPAITQWDPSDKAAPSQEAQPVGLGPGLSLEVRAWHRKSQRKPSAEKQLPRERRGRPCLSVFFTEVLVSQGADLELSPLNPLT